jgi:hypothetical protein
MVHEDKNEYKELFVQLKELTTKVFPVGYVKHHNKKLINTFWAGGGSFFPHAGKNEKFFSRMWFYEMRKKKLSSERFFPHLNITINDIWKKFLSVYWKGNNNKFSSLSIEVVVSIKKF